MNKGEYLIHSLSREIIGHAFPDEEGQHVGLVASVEEFVELFLQEIDEDIDHILWHRHATLL